ncbi:TetR/AcrR family transcriptional regulator [Streptomyces synnematoformans]|uniref:TetR/AcrR family transcriptional regulator n=1 Tax=Streptomyces synnematoformans TaxID=415721 RepID=A0ABN2XYD7_9ACTN
MATKQRGRPRSFDRDEALEKALHAFWQYGYEATSVADLTRALGIGAPSLYAAFGDKEALFDAAVEAYARTDNGTFIDRALAEEPTAVAAFTRILREAAVGYTAPDHPRGCMILSVGVSATTPEVVDKMRELRSLNLANLTARVRADVAAGVLPAQTDPEKLAGYTGAVLQGMSTQARDGADRDLLERVAEIAAAGLAVAAQGGEVGASGA